MNKQFETRDLVEHPAGLAVGRRSILKLARAYAATSLGVAVVLSGVGVVHGSTSSANEGAVMQQTQSGAGRLTQEWDKTFQKSDRVEHQKVTFKNRYGITLAADLYLPKNRDGGRLPALAVSGPFGAVKEQVSGLYAQTMGERGFVTLAFDPSYTGGKQWGASEHGIAGHQH